MDRLNSTQTKEKMDNPPTEPPKTIVSIQKIGASKSYHQYIEDGIKDHTAKAESYFKAGKLPAAKKEYKRIVFLDSSNREALLRLAEISSELEDYSAAIIYYKRAQRLMPEAAIEDKIYQLMLRKGQHMLQDGEFDPFLQLCKTHPVEENQDPEAEDLNSYSASLKNILIADPNATLTEAQSTFIRALAYMSENQKSKAIQELNVCTRLDPKNIYAHILKGKIHWSLNQVKEGNQAFWAAHAVDKDHPEVKEFVRIINEKSTNFHKMAVKLYFENDRHKSAFFINKALELDPKNVDYLLFRSFISRKNKDYERALQDIELASQYVSQSDTEQNQRLGHQLAITYNDMGISMMELKKFDDAVVIFNEAIKFKDDEWGVIVNRGDCFRQMGQWENAIKDYERALGLAGKNEEIHKRIGFCFHREALNCFNKKRYKDCAKLLEEASKFDPNNSEYQLLMSKCYLFINDTKNAYQTLKKAQSTDPANLEAKRSLSYFAPMQATRQSNKSLEMQKSATFSQTTKLPKINPPLF